MHFSPEYKSKVSEFLRKVFEPEKPKPEIRCTGCQQKFNLLFKVAGHKFCIPCLANHATRPHPTWEQFCEEFPEFGNIEAIWKLAGDERKRCEKK